MPLASAETTMGLLLHIKQKKKIPGMLSTKLQTLYNSLLVFTIAENDLWKLIPLREKQIILTNANANMFILQP